MNTKQKIFAREDFTEIRLKLGLSLRGIAKQSNVTPSIIWKMEKGQPILPSTARKICLATKTTFDELFILKKYQAKAGE